MKLATLRRGITTTAARIEDDEAILLPFPDITSLLWDGTYASAANGQRIPLNEAVFEPVVRPGKVICVGHNYVSHITEMGRQIPEYPTLFGKVSETITAPYADIELPPQSDSVDWEAELAVVIGSSTRHASELEAAAAIAGYSVANDVSMRDWQNRTIQWYQGKNFEATTPLGPWLVTPDEVDPVAGLDISCKVDGVIRQKANTSELVFPPAKLVAYISTIMTLNPGDVILTGTTGGVGAAMDPPVFVQDGQTVEVSVQGIGSVHNRFVRRNSA